MVFVKIVSKDVGSISNLGGTTLRGTFSLRKKGPLLETKRAISQSMLTIREKQTVIFNDYLLENNVYGKVVCPKNMCSKYANLHRALFRRRCLKCVRKTKQSYPAKTFV